MFRKTTDGGQKLSKHTNETSYYDVLIDALRKEEQTTWYGLLIEKLNDMKSNVTWGYSISEKDYEELLNWTLNKNNEKLLITLLDENFSKEFEEVIKKVLILTVRKNENNNVELLLNHSPYLKANIVNFQGKPSMFKHGI